MRRARWAGGRVFVEDVVAASRPTAGETLRESFPAAIGTLTLGVLRARGDSLMLGSVEMLRFGPPSVSGTAVEWPIEGGWTAGAPGGTWRIAASDGHLVASVAGYRPRLPRWLYTLTQLPVHRLLVRMFLLRMAGRAPVQNRAVASADRYRAAAVDVALCAALASLAGRRHRLLAFVSVAASYHVACWSLSGQTLGGRLMNQRVVASDGTRLSPGQAAVRLLALPVSWIRGRPDHDEIARTDVITVR